MQVCRGCKCFYSNSRSGKQKKWHWCQLCDGLCFGKQKNLCAVFIRIFMYHVQLVGLDGSNEKCWCARTYSFACGFMRSSRMAIATARDIKICMVFIHIRFKLFKLKSKTHFYRDVIESKWVTACIANLVGACILLVTRSSFLLFQFLRAIVRFIGFYLFLENDKNAYKRDLLPLITTIPIFIPIHLKAPNPHCSWSQSMPFCYQDQLKSNTFPI